MKYSSKSINLGYRRGAWLQPLGCRLLFWPFLFFSIGLIFAAEPLTSCMTFFLLIFLFYHHHKPPPCSSSRPPGCLVQPRHASPSPFALSPSLNIDHKLNIFISAASCLHPLVSCHLLLPLSQSFSLMLLSTPDTFSL